ncbi:BspA family leucine-rich repeat surface protein [Mycoplasma feriruminatoris]|uniref:Myrrcad domain-containing protein n=1 Tax=Mycoplasma feriruminatoris TaxID=1179777 RepID=A0AAQ3DN00_9MOLU|nr:BspA family leucine-rich repeat surface protein [Mycoplasma feriruminatoris]WFQ94925.1 Myrrcad domain-containing protein [Mycoplasma feriruminatoris]
MRKLLTILTSISSIFLMAATVALVDNLNKNNHNLFYNKTNDTANHEFQNAWGIYKKLTKIGYYRDGKHIRIKTIPAYVVEISADLPLQITSLKNAFVGNNQDVKWTVQWNTRNITDMSGVFFNTNYINDPSIAKWDTSNVTDMSKMFYGTKSFNQDISKWDVSKVKNFKEMFYNAKAFTHNLQDWKVSPNVNNTNFGLKDTNQPRWFKNESSNIENKTSPKPSEIVMPKPNQLENTDSIASEKSINTEPHKISKQPTDNLYKIPTTKPYASVSPKSSNTGTIVGTVLGTFIVLGVGAGVTYYYRNPLKTSFFKTKDWIKEKISKMKSK